MPLLAELVGDPPPTPAAMPRSMREDESFAMRSFFTSREGDIERGRGWRCDKSLAMVKTHQAALWHHNRSAMS